MSAKFSDLLSEALRVYGRFLPMLLKIALPILCLQTFVSIIIELSFSQPVTRSLVNFLQISLLEPFYMIALIAFLHQKINQQPLNYQRSILYNVMLLILLVNFSFLFCIFMFNHYPLIAITGYLFIPALSFMGLSICILESKSAFDSLYQSMLRLKGYIVRLVLLLLIFQFAYIKANQLLLSLVPTSEFVQVVAQNLLVSLPFDIISLFFVVLSYRLYCEHSPSPVK